MKAKKGRPVFEDRNKIKNTTMTLRLDNYQSEFVEKIKKAYEKIHGCPVTKTWIVLSFLEIGKKAWIDKYLKARK